MSNENKSPIPEQTISTINQTAYRIAIPVSKFQCKPIAFLKKGWFIRK